MGGRGPASRYLIVEHVLDRATGHTCDRTSARQAWTVSLDLYRFDGLPRYARQVAGIRLRPVAFDAPAPCLVLHRWRRLQTSPQYDEMRGKRHDMASSFPGTNE
jgi:hypothetical protein